MYQVTLRVLMYKPNTPIGILNSPMSLNCRIHMMCVVRCASDFIVSLLGGSYLMCIYVYLSSLSSPFPNHLYNDTKVQNEYTNSSCTKSHKVPIAITLPWK